MYFLQSKLLHIIEFFIRLHPKYDQAMNNLANILKDHDKLEEARSLLEKAVAIR